MGLGVVWCGVVWGGVGFRSVVVFGISINCANFLIDIRERGTSVELFILDLGTLTSHKGNLQL